MIFEVKEGKLKWDFASLKNGKYKCSELKETRSLQLNNYYWLCLWFIVEEYTNYWYVHTTDFLHDRFKRCFLPKVRVKSDFTKQFIYKAWTTTKLSNKEFVKYLNNIKLITEFWKLGEINWLEEISPFILPNPNDMDLLYYIDKQKIC
jgi:hypothetical protein